MNERFDPQAAAGGRIAAIKEMFALLHQLAVQADRLRGLERFVREERRRG